MLDEAKGQTKKSSIPSPGSVLQRAFKRLAYDWRRMGCKSMRSRALLTFSNAPQIEMNHANTNKNTENIINKKNGF